MVVVKVQPYNYYNGTMIPVKDRLVDRKTDRQTDRQMGFEIDRGKCTNTYKQTDRRTDRQQIDGQID